MSRRIRKASQTTLSGEVVEWYEEDIAWRDWAKDKADMIVYCPWCLHEGPLISFRLKTRSEYSKKMFECPECHVNMRLDTLTADWTISEYARWLYLQVTMFRSYGKVSWDKLFARLKEKRWAKEFWEAWRAAKDGRPSPVEDEVDYQTTMKTVNWTCPRTNESITGPCQDYKCNNNKNGVCYYPNVVKGR